jgi:hypothetical protein
MGAIVTDEAVPWQQEPPDTRSPRCLLEVRGLMREEGSFWDPSPLEGSASSGDRWSRFPAAYLLSGLDARGSDEPGGDQESKGHERDSDHFCGS